jgi:CheY-like chemotaxis protein
LEAIGRLAGGVAHDFNNLLTVVSASSDMLLEELPPDDPRREEVEHIRTAAQRATVLTRQLLALGRRQMMQPRVLDLNAIVLGLERMLPRLIGEDISVVLRLGERVGAVRADPGQIEQVLVNVAINARDAMPSGGTLTIETADTLLDASYAADHAGAAPGAHVMLAISDTGVGMDEETRAHIFEPFFTTKDASKGTGLGLSTVHGIVSQSGGSIAVESTPGRGTTFRIFLPRIDAPVATPTPERAAESVSGGETVLLVEDEAAVRRAALRALQMQGFVVMAAEHGPAALAAARAHAGPIHLLATDLVMPGMSGRELAAVLTAERPELRTLFMSGYTDDAEILRDVRDNGAAFLAKPYSPSELGAKVREVLDRA